MFDKLRKIDELMFAAGVAPASFFPAINAAPVVQAAGGRALAAHDLLYSWHNGQRMEDFYQSRTRPLWNEYFFLPLEDAVGRGRDAGIISGGRCWVPVLDNYAGEFIFVDLGDSDHWGQVGYSSVVPESEEPVEWRYASVETLIDDILDYWLSRSGKGGK